MVEKMHADVVIGFVVVGQFDAEKCFVDVILLVDGDGFAVEEGAALFPCVETFVARDDINHADEDLSFFSQGDGDSKRSIVMYEIGRAVQCIDYPAVCLIVVLCGFLLRDKARFNR